MKILSPLKAKAHKYDKLIGFDIETATKKNEFVLATFYCDEFTKVCYSKEDVITFLNSRKMRGYKVFATNLAFDFLGTLYEHSHRWKVVERNGTIYNFTWYQHVEEGCLKNPIKFYDTIRIFPASVEKLGKILKVPKMDYPSCFGQFPKDGRERQHLVRYCMNDSKISYLFMTQIVVPFLQKYNLPIKSTIGAIALQDFRRNYLNQVCFQESERNREIAFASYFGGRTETFQRGSFSNVFCFDVNSLYPSVMLKDMPDPNQSRHYVRGSLFNINKYEGVSEVEVFVPHTLNIPPLPVKHDSKLIFPTGTIKGHYNHNELRNALKYGCKIIKIKEQLVYPKTKKFFKQFVETHYAARRELQKENSPMEVMEKLLLNNLYGKFAFNYRESSSLIPAHDFNFEKHIENAKYIEPMFDGQFISVKDNEVKAPIYSFPIWSSYITSEARILMYEYLADQRLQHKIISTDTDSIFIKDYAGEIEESTVLGAMKLEDGYPIKQAIFVRPKMYMTHKPKCKGVQFKDQAKERFMDIMNGLPITQERFIKYRTAIKSMEHHKNGTLAPNEIIEITKTLNLNDTKRVWESDFNYQTQQTSKPINFDYILQTIHSTI